MESIEDKPKQKRQKNPNRIVLENGSVDCIKKVMEQIYDSFGGVIKLNYKEIANFLLQSRTGILTSSELNEIKSKYFDDIQATQWALQRLKEAKNAGQTLSLSEILNKINIPIVKTKRNVKLNNVDLANQEDSFLPHQQELN